VIDSKKQANGKNPKEEKGMEKEKQTSERAKEIDNLISQTRERKLNVLSTFRFLQKNGVSLPEYSKHLGLSNNPRRAQEEMS